eukprot:2091534-Rhodomonas_salina.1
MAVVSEIAPISAHSKQNCLSTRDQCTRNQKQHWIQRAEIAHISAKRLPEIAHISAKRLAEIAHISAKRLAVSH